MSKKDPRVDAYIAEAADFAKPILKYIRKAVHAGCPDVEESMKWSMPSFGHKGILCNMAAFKQHCTLGFWKGKLIVPARGGDDEEAAMGQFGRIQSLADLPKEEVLIGYVREAVRLNEAGVKNPAFTERKAKKELVIPDYVSAALRKNPRALATFEGFPPSHKREYVEWITEAKTEPTRERRLKTMLEWLVEGKSRNWKYENC